MARRDLDAANVGRMIEPQGRPAQRVAERARQFLIGRRQRQRRRQACCNVGCEGRPGENGPASIGRGLSQNLGHERVRAALDALGAGDQRRRPRRRREPLSHFATRLSRRRHQNRVAASKRFQIRCRRDGTGQINAGQPLAAPRLGDGPHSRVIAAPQDDRAAGGRGRVRERNAPGACAGDADDICGPHVVSRRIRSSSRITGTTEAATARPASAGGALRSCS